MSFINWQAVLVIGIFICLYAAVVFYLLHRLEQDQKKIPQDIKDKAKEIEQDIKEIEDAGYDVYVSNRNQVILSIKRK